MNVFFLFCGSLTNMFGQNYSLHGQASGWLTSNPEKTPISQTGLRYIPELSVHQKIDSTLETDIDASINSYLISNFAHNQHPTYEEKIKPYRIWFRFATNTIEARVGLQKINFGSAMFFRPLMWFDRIDPRDPLQLTDGVYGLLLRYYLLNNTNFWMWGLYGNNDTKGWETIPTRENSIEYGGRMQTPLWNGEIGLTYHHRVADFKGIMNLVDTANETFVPEHRIGIDGKWDIGIGIWCEGTLTYKQTVLAPMKYQRLWTLGADYTIDIGNGLYIATEYFRSENPNEPFTSASGIGLSALSVNYPLGIIDRISGILYHDWTHNEWYRLLTWQRTYDNWIFYILGFWNPEKIQLYQNQTGNNSFAGTGLQLMITFNH